MYTMVCISGRFSALAASHWPLSTDRNPPLTISIIYAPSTKEMDSTEIQNCVPHCQRSVEEEQYNDSRDTAAHYGVKARI